MALLTRPAFSLRPGAHLENPGVTYAIWAPSHLEMHVQVKRRSGFQETLALARVDEGYFVGHDPQGHAGDRYFFQLPDGQLLPDVRSRFQPEGVHGPSEVIDPSAYIWQTAGWQRTGWRNHVIYEVHVGTFTSEGTFRAAIGKLDHVRALGATAIEIMPVADFPGGRNWGYDGVSLYAPARCYGRPDDLRALVDAAHARGLVVILDVVYNHLGPDGNYLQHYAAGYFHPTRVNPWGRGFSLDHETSQPVRDYLGGNAMYWLDEFRVDGLRLDATHAILDESERHLLAEIAEEVHRRGGFAIAEDERNLAELVATENGGGMGLDAVWSDDFHHEVRVAVTGARESYFANFTGSLADLAQTLDQGWFYRGQPFLTWQGRPRGQPARHLPANAFVVCIENHDQVGNRAKGERLEQLISPAAFRAASALVCLSPYPPLLFMGQEWAASTPFLFFTDHTGELGRNISVGRKKEFAATGMNQGIDDVPDPQEDATFRSSKLSWDELAQPAHAATLQLYREALAARAAWLAHDGEDRVYWTVNTADPFLLLHFFPPQGPERLLAVRLHDGAAHELAKTLEACPPKRGQWHLVFHTEESRFGGSDVDPKNSVQPKVLSSGPIAALFTTEETL